MQSIVVTIGLLLLILMLHTHITYIPILLTFTRQTLTFASMVSRCTTLQKPVRGGLVGLNTGSLRNAGSNSYYWSSTTYPNAIDAYDLTFNDTNVVPSTYNSRFLGFSVRGGAVNISTGSLKFASINSYYWSATIYPNTTNAYRFHFNDGVVHPSAYSNRFDGFLACAYAAGMFF